MTSQFPQKHSLPAVRVSNEDHEQLARVTRVIASAFERIPISLAIINSVDGDVYSPDRGPSQERRYKHFEPQVKLYAKSGATIIQALDWSAIAIWSPPDCVPDEETEGNLLVAEFFDQCDKAKQKHLSISKTPGSSLKPFYHLEFLARDPSTPSVPGLISALITPWLEQAKREGVPVWLEAGNKRAVQIYEHYGFRVVEELVSGRGRYGADGYPKQDGEGFSEWAMLYEPDPK